MDIALDTQKNMFMKEAGNNSLSEANFMPEERKRV